MKRKFEREERHAIIVDMNDFLLMYAIQVLGRDQKDLAGTLYNAGKDDLTGLDRLFGDSGVGRLTKYHDIAEGSAKNLYDYSPERAAKEADVFSDEAMKYLGQHIEDFNHWIEE